MVAMPEPTSKDLVARQHTRLVTRFRQPISSDAATGTAQIFQQYVDQYFDAVDDQPIRKAVHAWHRGQLKVEYVQAPQPYHMAALRRSLAISSKERWEAIKRDRPDLEPIMSEAEDRVRFQQLNGAMVDLFNPQIVSRLQGLADKTETATTAPEKPAQPQVDPDLIADKAHPDDPDPTGVISGVFPRPLYSQAQINAGVPFTLPPTEGIIDHV